MPSPSLKDLVDEWLLLDPNPETRNEIQTLWNRCDIDELEKRLRTRIDFGTAGLRGRMEAGWSRMNDLIILQTSQGLSEYILQHVEMARDRGLVVGYDHRHHSEHWAILTANIFVAKGIKVYLLRGFNHTPMVPFAVKKLNAACGVMITASHNPKQDNGYKVYWENAVQIVPPHDKGISIAIQTNLRSQPAVEDASSSELLLDLTEHLRSEYFEYLRNSVTNRDINIGTIVKFVNTSMHGVGDYFVKEGFTVFGFPPYTPVAKQQSPDPEFSTVPFPNPEEKGALDLAIETAEREGADYVLAQDPDADRFTAAQKGPTGEWILFTGDQLGSIFAARVLEAYKASGQPVNKLAMVASTVSSKMIETMAEVEGFKFVECLTGFKFIGNTALRLVADGFTVPLGYEEAIGFMFGSQIRDKDGVAATMIFAELCAELRVKGMTVNDYLQELYQRYGYFQTKNSYFICNDPKVTDEIFSHIRRWGSSGSTGTTYPDTLAELPINRIIDLTTGYDSGNPPAYLPSLPLSSGHMVQFRASSCSNEINLVLTLRTSGTEPKIKIYLEGNGRDSKLVDQQLSKAITDISEKWIRADKYSLKMG
ncbi:hypothetical protein GALMADRAFT_239221 [Galerina marginata CBS 339.88]|uniref:Phosphoglucomutase n=1 Tax=Galerina marginata (strain CBS 339.88) TaxID=685588 RepID=A0A067TDR6_GALM3|nr:hypothetical protein GALMADRAFT_239221 [Galerina marginata CBS 339.88]